jgi:uncharacterized protein YndB with AHSA1/START domain
MDDSRTDSAVQMRYLQERVWHALCMSEVRAKWWKKPHSRASDLLPADDHEHKKRLSQSRGQRIGNGRCRGRSTWEPIDAGQ